MRLDGNQYLTLGNYVVTDGNNSFKALAFTL
jgi:hypothetical protein